MDRVAKWASTGSLAWLFMAAGLILGTHGTSLNDAGAIAPPEESAAATCPETGAATPVVVTMDKHRAS